MTKATKKNIFRHQILSGDKSQQVAEHLQKNLSNLIDLALLLKQAHWNIVGPAFRSNHLQLDEIIESVRDASDEVAERMAQIGVSPDGRTGTVAKTSCLDNYPDGFVKVAVTITKTADALKATIDSLRESIGALGELDPITEDLCIGISAILEKHLWMVQAREV